MNTDNMSLFSWKKNLAISEKEPVYKVRYLGNVQTVMMKGDGCVDKPVTVIWNNYVRSGNPGLEMKLTITGTGLRAHTKEQGITDYRAHRLSYCIAHPKYPKLFVWVYRHEGKKMKMELRCHAVLCKTEAKAKALAVQLAQKLDFALREFMREKTRKQNSRLVLQRTNSLPVSGHVLPKRTQILSTGQNFKPPISKSNTAPRLGAIEEDIELCEDIEEEEERESEEQNAPTSPTFDALTLHDTRMEGICQKIIDIEIGNDIEELKQDEEVQFCISNGDSDDESSESGFHEAEPEPEPYDTCDDHDDDEATSNGTSADDDKFESLPVGTGGCSLQDFGNVCDNPTGLYVEQSTVVTSL